MIHHASSITDSVGRQCHRRMPRASRRTRRGAASLIAMLYLVLFSTLALSFFAAFTLATQSAYNERSARRALAAAESGMEFIRFHLWDLDIAHDTPPDDLFDRVYEQLAQRLNGSLNLGGGNIARYGNTILIPGDPDAYIKTDSRGESFRLSITRDGKELIVAAAGKNPGGNPLASDIDRGIRLNYGIYERPSAIFDFGVASKSSINMTGNTAILGSPNPAAGSVLSTASVDYPLTMGNSSVISGEVAFSNPDAWVKAGNNSIINGQVGEANWSDSVHHVPEPDFPVVGTADYFSYATKKITDSQPKEKTYENIIIPPNTNPTFAAGTEINGVVYIQGPNKVKFAGHVKINGIIVVEDDAPGTWTSNAIEFRGTVTAGGMDALPDDPKFDGLKEMGGAFILAENFTVDFSGNADAGATEVVGSIVASNISFSGTADATVNGSIINLESSSAVNFSGNSAVTVKSSGTSSQPHGLYFGSRYVPLPGSYEEVIP